MKNPLESGKAFLLEARESTKDPLVAYAVDGKGNIVERQSIGEKGEFKFKGGNGGEKLLIAPNLEGMPTPKNLGDLRHLGAYEPVLKFNPKLKIQAVRPIPELLIKDWFLCRCRVRGRLIKEYCFSLPGFPPFFTPRNICFSLPVCPARVHVCRLRRNIWEILPDRDIFDIRDKLVRIPLDLPFPLPEPEPFVLPDIPRPMQALSLRSASATQALTAAPQTAFSAAFQTKLASQSPAALRLAMQQHFEEFRSFLPFFDICSILYRKEEIMVIDVDEQGRFDEYFWHRCGQNEDLYFWVEYLFNGSWVTVYHPRFCSGAHWDYVCGSEVTIKITDPRVSGCRPVRSRFMEVTRVGTQAYLPLIDQSTGLVSGIDFSDGVTGATGASLQRPFGKELAIWADFGSNLPETATATHYKVSVRPVTSPASAWQPISRDLNRTYVDEVEGSDGITRVYYRDFNLRDKDNPDFYLIPQHDAMNQAEIPKPAGLQERVWYYGAEFVIALWDTSAIPHGDYEMKIELCKQVGGTLQPVAVRRELFQTPNPSDFSESELAPPQHLLGYTPADGNARGFIMRLRVDNRACSATIDDAEVNNNASDPNCGLLYTALNGTNTARLGFRAAHPDNKGTYRFGMVRGNGQTNGLGAVPVSGVLGTVNNGYTLLGDNYSRADFDANVWIDAGSCANGAAFAQSLSVLAMATDGTQRLQAYDAPYRMAAFAIIAECDCAD